MTKLALVAEEKLAYSEKEAARLTAKLDRVNGQVSALETAASQATIQHDVTVGKIQQDLLQSRAEAEGEKERGKLLVDLMRETYSMAAGVIANAGTLGDQLVNCCSELGTADGTLKEMRQYQAQELVPFLPGANPDQLRDEVRKNGEILIKRKSEGQVQEATTQDMEQ
ncbi:hypothetical protein PHYSODRAFT_262454 [Phytophthora sojae]|uniref:Uncharacterized protein n=1 Tax=Phytophthora sojae (strain P6497) TaxID=1094619 RepID=G4ZHD3_PHYSP|nr:hypothetical protein PHYSODRAFT_262454 [Phytophthora sojae]EGZ17603.1 hypothetical protein PHYSODRAFT_262454 [Phytophthora sojae]|eukprot:XP_009526661.1 hypothetical protein PHYSODRAFT_262454 [Phytophthora sojae]